MKIFTGVAVNTSVTEDADGPRGCGELVLIYSEAQWSVDAAGEINRQSRVDSHRLMFSAKSMRQLMKHLDQYATLLEDLERRTRIEEKTATIDT